MQTRIQRKRTKGFTLPANTQVVTRPTRWGNPYLVTDYGREGAIQQYETMLAQMLPTVRERFLAPLRGKHLACWCNLSVRCHADVLLKWANR